MTIKFESIRDTTANFQNRWKPAYNWDNCKLHRKEYGQFVASYLSREERSLVLNLDGAWGSGKTEFLKRLYTEFIDRKHACVYIDAWESDFSGNPLLVVSSELLEQLGCIENHLRESFNEIRKSLGKFLRNTTPEVASAISQAILGTGTPGKLLAETVIKSISDKDITNKLSSAHQECIDALYSVKNQLGNLSEKLIAHGYKSKIIILIDELDRCRPTYAIELLEVIKHFFNVPNFSFIIATDTEQLGHSIKAVYGSNFDSIRYLRRFFDHKLELPSPSIEHYLSLQKIDLKPSQEKLTLLPSNINHDLTLLIISSLLEGYNLKIRDIDQLLNKFTACINAAIDEAERTNCHQVIHWFTLFFALIEYEENHELFSLRTNKNSPAPTIPNNFQLPSDFSSTKISIHDFVEQHLAFVKTQEVSREDAWGEQNRNDERFRMQEYINLANQIGNKKLHAYYLAIYNDLNRFITGTPHHLWHWSSYKSMVELAGYIDSP